MKWIWPKNQSEDIREHILKTRNISNPEEFFNPGPKSFTDPALLYGATNAAKIIIEAIKAKKKIFIHGDFDVDGITSTTILWSFLYKDLNANVTPFIPNRFTEGYGLSAETISKIIEQGGELIITVDCGVKDIALVEKYKDKIDFIITDHHTITPWIGQEENSGAKKIGNYAVSRFAKAVVHPKLNQKIYNEICAANVAWKLCLVINELIGTGIDLNKYLEFVAMGTVCDIMPLINENRAIVIEGVKRLRESENPGIKALCNVAQINQKAITSYHIGYVLGPRLNASGRLGSAMDAVRLFCTDSKENANTVAVKLNKLNLERQALTQKYLELAEQEVAKETTKKILFIVGDEWPEGILGLIAGRLCEKYGIPVIVGSNKNGIIKASARSIAGFHISEVLKSFSSDLKAYGGHSQAAGLTLLYPNFAGFLEKISAFANKNISSKMLEKKIVIDAATEIGDINNDLFSFIKGFEPFGGGNNKIIFGMRSLKVKSSRLIGRAKEHVKIILTKSEKEFAEGVFFNGAPSIKLLETATLLDAAFYLDENEYLRKKSLFLNIADIKPSN